MSKTDSRRDVELLAALTNRDSAKFQRIISKLRGEAGCVASELADEQNVEDVVSEAIDKAIDWLKSDAVFQVSSPYRYARKIVRNKVIDYCRTSRVKSIADDDIAKDLAWLDESMGYFGEDEKSGESITAWHGFRLKSISRGKTTVPTYPEHRWLRALQPSRYTDWFFVDTSRNARDKRWTHYKLIMALIENIPSLSEQRIIKHFLFGYRVTDIARQLSIDKSYASRVITKWLGSWGWDKAEVERNRIVLLTRYLAATLKRYYKPGPKEYPELKDRMGVLWRKRRLTKEEEEELDRLTRELRARAKLEEQEDERRLCDKLYQNITKASETKVYLEDMQESDSLGLYRVCCDCVRLWYPGLIG